MPQLRATRHNPTELFTDGDSVRKAKNRALVILHQPIASKTLIEHLWHQSAFHICADGAANQLHDLYAGDEHLLPDRIHGDLDSIRPDIRDYYTSKGVLITQDQDQYSTDFGKAMQIVAEELPDATDVLVLGGLGGRVDQGIGILGELLREERRAQQRLNSKDFKIWLISERSVSFWIDDNEKCNIILDSIHGQNAIFTASAGILPLQGKAYITTKGFEWDITNWETEMGGQVSTSNHVVAEEVEVETDVAVLFTVERRRFSDKHGD